MSIIDWVKNKIVRQPLPTSAEGVVIPIETSTLSQIMARAKNNMQIQKLIAAAKQLESIWQDDEKRNIVRVMFMVEEAYPYLEKMSKHEPMSTEWMEAFSDALEATNNNTERLAQETEEVNNVIDQILKEK